MIRRSWLGLLACAAMIVSTFMRWTWYPDIQKYFTGFFTEDNYYGRPGIFLCTMAAIGLLAYLFQKVWLFRLNLVAAALGMAYAIKSFLLFTSSYDGYVPEKQPGIYIMLVASLLNVAIAMVSLNKPAGNPGKEG
ncbi:MAG: hypothetical protein MUF29_05255 [Chitinophagaceae bacterium]|jgi:uncharacterized membrane protein YfhO|nr:hypothetical protein [Chitinophagaceae bacterium]